MLRQAQHRRLGSRTLPRRARGMNTLTPLTDDKEIARRLLAYVIKPFVTADWWHKTLDLIVDLAKVAPCYVMGFDKSGEIAGKIKRVTGSEVQRFNG